MQHTEKIEIRMGEVWKYIEDKYGLKWRTENDIDDWHTAFTIWNYEVNNKGKKWYDESIKKVKKISKVEK